MKITDKKLQEEIRNDIESHYDGSFYKLISALHNRDGEAWELYMFEEDVEHEGKTYRCTLINKENYDPEDIECLLDVEYVFENYEEL